MKSLLNKMEFETDSKKREDLISEFEKIKESLIDAMSDHEEIMKS